MKAPPEPIGLQPLGKAKVCQLELPILTQQKVLGLHILVYNVPEVAVPEPLSKLTHHPAAQQYISCWALNRAVARDSNDGDGLPRWLNEM